MRLNHDETAGRTVTLAKSMGLTLALTLFAMGAGAQAPAADAKPNTDSYKTFYLTNLTQDHDANDIQTDLRNMLPRAQLFYVPSQGAITMHGTPEDLALAQKILADLDRTKKIYRLTYTITDTDGGKRIGEQHFSFIVASGSRTELKQGSKVPIVVGTANGAPATPSSDIQYLDVGLDIEASLDGYLDGVRLRTKLAQSSVAEEKSSAAMNDPVIRQTTLVGTSTLVQGKPLVLGSLDIPGSTRHQEVEVVSELVR